MVSGLGWAGEERTRIDLKIGRDSRLPLQGRPFSRSSPWSYRDSDLVVSDTQSTDRSTIPPDHVVNRPTLRIRLPRKDRVVSNNISLESLYTSSGNLVCNFNQIVQGRNFSLWSIFCLPRCVVWKIIAAQIAITSPNNHDVTIYRLIFTSYTSIFDTRCESLVRPQQRHRGSGRKQLGVAVGLEELGLVERIDRPAVERGHHHAPVRARDRGLRHQRRNLLRQGERRLLRQRQRGRDNLRLRCCDTRRLAQCQTARRSQRRRTHRCTNRSLQSNPPPHPARSLAPCARGLIDLVGCAADRRRSSSSLAAIPRQGDRREA